MKNAFGFFRSGNSKSWITEYIKKNKNINLIDLCDESIEIPQLGTKHSLNVSVATGIVIWKYYEMLKNQNI